MNELLEDLVATLKADATLTGITNRIYPDQAPQGAAYPYLIYQGVSLAGMYKLAGPAGVRMRRIQFDAYAVRKADAVAIVDRVLDLFDGIKQTLNSRTQILICTIEGSDGEYDDQEHIYRERLDLNFTYRT